MFKIINPMPNIRSGSFRAFICAGLISLVIALPAGAQNSVPKLVYLVTDADHLIASNIQRNRFDELRLEAKEKPLQQAVANAVIVVATNQRIVAYSVYTASWKRLDLKAEEDIMSIEAEDYSALIQTNKRLISFNGETGVWAQTRRSRPARSWRRSTALHAPEATSSSRTASP